MQFASLTGTSGHAILLDALEYDFFQRRAELPDEKVNEAAFIWKLCYGAFLPQLHYDPVAAASEISAYEGAAFGSITRDGTCRLAEVKRLHLYAPVSRARTSYYPCAALIGTLDEIPPEESEAALALFPRFLGQMDARTNLVNRPGVLALKGEIESARAALHEYPNTPDWLRFASEERAAQIARTIY